MEVGSLIAFQGIFPLEDTTRDDVDEIDEIDTKHCHGGRDLPSGDDREGREEKSEHDRARVSHKTETLDIETSHEECDRDDNREDSEEKSTIFLCGEGGIDHEKLHREASEDDKCDESKSSCQSRDTIREIHRIKYEDIPKYRDEYRKEIEGKGRLSECRAPGVSREIQYPSEGS